MGFAARRPDASVISSAKRLIFEPPLDEGIRETVEVLARNGVETFQGGKVHTCSVPTIGFEGSSGEGL
jgi:hypothetical protein